MLFIRKLRLAYIVCIGFLQCGIPHRMYRFYCCLAAHQRTKEKDSAEPLSSILWTPPPHPGKSAAAGKCRLPRAWGNLGSCIQVQIDNRQFRMLFSYLCSALYRSRFSRGAQLGTFVFHYWGRGCSFLRLHEVLL